MVNCWERAYLLALLYVMFFVCFVTFPCGFLGQVWDLIVSIPDLAFFPTFKMWALTTPLGYTLQFEPYQGKRRNPAPNKAHLGMDGTMVIYLLSELQKDNAYHVTFDNLFIAYANKMNSALKHFTGHNFDGIKRDLHYIALCPTSTIYI